MSSSTGLACLSFSLLAGCQADQELGASYQIEAGRCIYSHWNEGFGTVRDNVYGADAGSFRQLHEPEYAVDKSAAYFRGERIRGADPQSFHQIKGSYWADKFRVYIDARVLPGSDPDSFRVLAISPWSCDKSNCYRAAERLARSDPKSFAPINFYWAKDSRNYYAADFVLGISIVDCDYPTMEILNSKSNTATYAKDRYHAYWLGRTIFDADPATFEVINDTMAKDKFRRYSGAKEYWVDKKAHENNKPAS